MSLAKRVGEREVVGAAIARDEPVTRAAYEEDERAKLKSILLVAIGGAVGSVARYKLSGVILHHAVAWRFPIGTFLVNVLGCLIIGLLAGLAVKEEFFSSDTRLLLFTGVCGGFTTFSAFGLEAFYLVRREEIWVAGSYVLFSVVGGAGCFMAGLPGVGALARVGGGSYRLGALIVHAIGRLATLIALLRRCRIIVANHV